MSLPEEILRIILYMNRERRTRMNFCGVSWRVRSAGRLDVSALLCLPSHLLGEITKHLDGFCLASLRACDSWLDEMIMKKGYRVEFIQLVDKEGICSSEYYLDEEHVCDDYMHAVKRQDYHLRTLWLLDNDQGGPSEYLLNITEMELRLALEKEFRGRQGERRLRELELVMKAGLLARLEWIGLDMIVSDVGGMEEIEDVDMVLLPECAVDFREMCQDYWITV